MTLSIHTNCGLDKHHFPDGSLIPTTRGELSMGSVKVATSATLAAPGVDANGDVVYTAVGGGAWGNDVTIEHDLGELGVENDRALAVEVAGKAVKVVFGTGPAGESDPPTAQELADAVNANADATRLVSASPGGTGASDADEIAATPLSGGVNDGDYLVIQGRFTQLVANKESI